jgi:hypothetical protein
MALSQRTESRPKPPEIPKHSRTKKPRISGAFDFRIEKITAYEG